MKDRRSTPAARPRNDANRTLIGDRLKQVRKAAGLTLQATSDRTGVSVSTLSKMENHQISVSFDIIKRVTDGLELSLEEFVNTQHRTFASGRRTITRRGEGVDFTSGQYDYKAHATDLSRKGMVPLEIWVRARTVDAFDHWSRHDGEEYVYVIDGEIEVHTEHYAPFRLGVGESAYFDSNMAHVYISLSEADAHVLSISYDPNSGARRIEHFMNPSVQTAEPK